ncbi:MAG: hypothetical protein O9331_19495 [Acidovorax sp.]|nr:hypothetical protein [Acidovorax sp.]
MVSRFKKKKPIALINKALAAIFLIANQGKTLGEKCGFFVVAHSRC